MTIRQPTRRRALVLAAVALSLGACGGSDSVPPAEVITYVEAAGVIDPAFGTGGLAKISPSQGLSASEIAEIGDGSLLVGGANPFIAKLTAQGQLDATFAVNGIDAARRGTKYFQTVKNITPLSAERIAIVEEHKSPCAATPFTCLSLTFGDLVARRIDTSGNPDPAYGDAGLGSLPYSQGAIVVAPGGRVVSFTLRPSGPTTEFGVASLDPSGQRDTGFETRARAALQCGGRFDPALTQVASAGATMAGDKIIVATAWQGASTHPQSFCVSRLNADGTIDTGFADQGHRIFAPVGSPALNVFRVRVRSSGEVVVVLSPRPGTSDLSPPVLLLLTASGARDTSIDASGVQSMPIILVASLFDLVLQPNGKIVYVGQSSLSPGIPTLPLDEENPKAGRSSSTAGIYDGGFGPFRGGYAILKTAESAIRPNKIVVDRRGGILVGGDLVSTGQPAVLRLK